MNMNIDLNSLMNNLNPEVLSKLMETYTQMNNSVAPQPQAVPTQIPTDIVQTLKAAHWNDAQIAEIWTEVHKGKGKIKGNYSAIVKFVRDRLRANGVKIQNQSVQNSVQNPSIPVVQVGGNQKVDDKDSWGAPVFVADSGAKTKIGVSVNSKSGRIGVRSFYQDKDGNFKPSGNGMVFVSKDVAKAVATFLMKL